MAISGNNGFYGVATQADRDTFQANMANYVWFEALTAPFQIAEQARTRLPTIGDDPFPRGAYKAGVGLTSRLGLEMTPNVIGQMLYYTLGARYSAAAWTVDIGTNDGDVNFTVDLTYDGVTETLTLTGPVTLSSIRSVLATHQSVASPDDIAVFQVNLDEFRVAFPLMPTATLALNEDTGSTGVVVASDTEHFGHIFRMDAADRYRLPYFSIVRGVGPGTIQERGTGCKVAGMKVEFTAGTSVQALWEIQGRKPDRSSDSVDTRYDDDVLLTMIDESADIQLMINGVPYTSDAIDVVSASFQLNNLLTPLTRFKIGSPYTISLDCLDREASAGLNLEVNNSALYEAVNYNPDGAWKNVPALGSYSITAANSDAVPQTLRMRAANVFFNGMLIANEPRRIVEAQLQAVALRSQTLQSVQFELLNRQASYV